MKKNILLFLIILFLGGCYDYSEIDDLSLITGMVIDYENNMYKITSQVIENKDKENIKIYTNTCKTIDECIYKISQNSNKDIFISHLKTLFITENTILNKTDFYDYFLREPKSKMNFHLYYIDSKDIDDIMNIYKDNEGSSLYLKDLILINHRIYSSSVGVYFLDYIQKVLDYGISPIYQSVSIKDNNIYLDKLIVFNNKNKIILQDNEGIYYNILTNNIIKSLIEIPCNKSNYSLEITNSKTSYNYNNNILNINIKLKSNISTFNCNFKLDNKKNIDKISNITNKYIKNELNNLIEKSKYNNTDFLGLSSYIYKHTKKKTNIKDIKTNIKVNTIIDTIGEMKNEF